MGDRQVVVTQHFTSGPPAIPFSNQGGDVDTIAIEKQEEWIKKRKVEQVTTKQIETRIKRQVLVTEDGEIVDDSGPQVTTNTTEDTETKREEHTEKKGGDEDGVVALPPEGWVAIPGAVIVREKHEKKSNTRDETNERLETEEVHHLGPITNEELEDALENQRETGQLAIFRRQSSGSDLDSKERQLLSPYSSEKRIVHQSRKHKRIIDQENTEERSEEKDGKITTETTKHEHHEEVDDDEQPDEEGRPASNTSSIHEVVKETRNNYTTSKDEDQVEYIAVPKGGNVLSSGVKLGRGPRHSTQQTVQYDQSGIPNQIPSLPADVTTSRQPEPVPLPSAPVQQPQVPVTERTDALTKQPLDLEAEEETRKLETSRWLESHFGSESSHSSTEGGEKKSKKKMPVSQQVSSGGINVTMTSDPIVGNDQRYEAPTFPAPPPPPLPSGESMASSRIYATTGEKTIHQRISEMNKTINQNPPRYASLNERVQVLPVGPDKLFMRNSVDSPPQSPTYQQPQKQFSSSGYQSGLNINQQPASSSNSRPDWYRHLSPERNSISQPSTVKRAASFNPASGSFNKPDYSWMKANREESTREQQQSSISTRNSFLSSVNNNNTNYGRPVEPKTYSRPEAPMYSSTVVKRWPPPPNRDMEEEDAEIFRPLDPTQQKTGGTIIRLGPENNNGPISPVRKNSGNGIHRTQSMFSPNNSNSMSPSNRMNLINSSLQSVPERERVQPKSGYDRQQQSGSYFIDVDRSFSSLNASHGNAKPIKVIQTFYGKTPPPRPAPPSHYASSTLGRNSESFRIPKSPPMFANDLDGDTPPVRPVRRNKSKRTVSSSLSKTDSGTQTVLPSNSVRSTQQPQEVKEPAAVKKTDYIKSLDMMSRTLDRPEGKPIKQYYMGEDPFKSNKGRETSPVHIKTVLTNGHAESAQRKSMEVVRSQTLPRRPSKPFEMSPPPGNNMNTSRNFYSEQDRSLNDTFGNQNSPAQKKIISPPKRSPSPPSNMQRSSINNVVNRSQSFAHVEKLQERRLSNPVTSPIRLSSMKTASSPMAKSNLTNRPLYNSTSVLNRLNISSSNNDRSFGTLKSPGIVTSISKSQLDLTNSSDMNSSSALYTLPRRSSRASPPKTGPPVDILCPPVKSSTPLQSGMSDRLAQLSPTTDGPRGETYSSMHRRKMQAAAVSETKNDQELNGQLNFQTSSRISPGRSFQAAKPLNQTINEESEPEAKSLKDRIALLESAGIQYGNASNTIPRVVSNKAKGAPPPPPPRVSSVLTNPRQKDTSPPFMGSHVEPSDPNGEVKREKFLQGLLNTAPELFMHIHGDENLKDIHVSRDDIIDGKNPARLPQTPSPPPPPPPPQPAFNNRVFTASTNHHSSSLFNKTSIDTPSGRSAGMMDTSAPLTPPPPLLSAIRGHSNSPFGSQPDLALRRGSLNSNGSSSIIPAVRIPPPVNYSETVRIKSNQDLDNQSDSVQSYSKRVQPFVDGFSSETKQSSQQTTLTRSNYTTGPSGSTHNIPDLSKSSSSSSPFQIRPQESGGVIISVRGNGQ